MRRVASSDSDKNFEALDLSRRNIAMGVDRTAMDVDRIAMDVDRIAIVVLCSNLGSSILSKRYSVIAIKALP